MEKAYQKEYNKSTPVFSAIRDKILSGELTDGTKLPSIKKLSASFGVSFKTILSAMKQLEELHLIIRRKGSGIYVQSEKKGQALKLCDELTDNSKDRKIADELIQDIAHGRWKVGNYLPVKKILQFQYKTSKHTLNKALKLVEKDGFIFRKAFGFMVGKKIETSQRPKRNLIYIIANQERLLTCMHYYSRLKNEFYPEFEKEISKYGASVSYLDLSDLSQTLWSRISKSNTIGFLYLVDYKRLSALSKNPEELLRNELQLLAKTRLPVVVYSYFEIASYFHPFSCDFGDNVYVLGVRDDVQAGEELAAFLASLGHKSVAYFSLFNTQWCQKRFWGLEKELKRIFSSQAKVIHYSAGLDESMESLPATAKEFEKTVPYLTRKGIQSLERAIMNLAREEHLFQHYDPFTNLVKNSYEVLKHIIRYKSLQSCFEEALKSKDTTAWVGADLLHSLLAAEFLEKNKIKVPEDLSIAGFDDKDYGALRDITGHDFQTRLMGYLAAHCLFKDIPIRRNRNRFVECPGMVFARNSTREV